MNLPITVGFSSTLKIRAILASEDIRKDQVIERCPVILVDMKDFHHIKKTNLLNYYFDWTKEYFCIVLGYGSLYNHSYTPNARYTFDYTRKVLLFTAIKDIKKGEEIFVNYNYFPRSKGKLDPGLLSQDKTYNIRDN